LYNPNPLWNLPVNLQASSTFDVAIEKWLSTFQPDYLLEEASSCVATALSCGFDGFVMLQGILGHLASECSSKVYARTAPTYYGMVVATIKRNSNYGV